MLFDSVISMVCVQGSMFAVTLYNAVYLYLKLASEALKKGRNGTDIKNGKFMYKQAQNYHTRTRKYCSLVLFGVLVINY